MLFVHEGKRYKRVKRKANIGELILITYDLLNIKGKVFEVISIGEDSVETSNGVTVFDDEYEVLEYDTEINHDNKSDVELFREICREITDLYERKNHDYGNSFSEQFKEYGLLSGVIRLDDKMKRLKQLMKHKAKVKDESIEDTVRDMAGYCIMILMELRKEKRNE
jgi:Nucleotide modification associated domain 1